MSIRELTMDELDTFTKETNIVFVDFWAPWCGPCKALAKNLDDLSNDGFFDKHEGLLQFGKFNVEVSPEVAVKYGVVNIPHIAVFKNGKKVDSMVGFSGKDKLKAFLSKYVDT